VATAPPTWEQYQRLILPFTAHLGIDGKRPPLYTPCRALFHLRRPLEAQYDDHHVLGFLGFGLIRSLSTPVAMSRPGLEHHWSTKETTPARQLQGIACPPKDPGFFTVPSSTSPRHPRDGRPLPGHVATATSTTPVAPSPPRHYLWFFVHLGLHLSL
jgi:hypothetical protein